MKDTFTYHHNFDDYSVELELELDVYEPRHPDIDDVAEIEILKATVMEDIEDTHKTGDDFDIRLIDEADVAEQYFNRNGCSLW